MDTNSDATPYEPVSAISTSSGLELHPLYRPQLPVTQQVEGGTKCALGERTTKSRLICWIRLQC